MIPRDPETAEEVLSVLSLGTQGVNRLQPDQMTPDQVHRLRLIVSELDRLAVSKWKA